MRICDSTIIKYLEKNILYVRDKVKDGASLSEELNKLDIFPMLVSEMAKVGEETGNMPQVFNRISAHYQRELSTRLERLVAAFEPIMIIVIGAIIAVIVVSLFLPLFKIAGIAEKI